MSEGITLTGDRIHAFADATAMRAISIEILTGMQMTGKCSGLEALRRRGLIEGRTTKVAGFRKALKVMKERYPEWEPSGNVAKVIEKLEADKKARKASK